MTDQELLLLNNLMYLNPDMVNEDMEGKTIGRILESVDAAGIEAMANDLTPGEDWGRILDGMKNSGEISSLTLVDIHTDGAGARMACFESPSGDAVVAFQGTGSSTEWKDNCLGGFQTNTAQQESALEWFNSLPYDDIAVTGHSKGGNKAMYVTLLSDKAGRCVSYDGQGFSNEFCDEYKSEIALNRDKITSYAVDNDFVNILLNDVSGKKVYLEGNNVDVFADNHCPDTAFFTDENGNLQIRVTEQSETMETMEGFVNYVLNTSSDAEREEMLTLLADVAQMVTEPGADLKLVFEYVLQSGNEESAGLLLAYIYRYEKENEGITDSIRDIMLSIDGTKDNVWMLDLVDYLLEKELVEKILKGIVSMDWLLSHVISRFVDLDPEQLQSLLRMLQIMFEKEGDLPYSEELTKPYDLGLDGGGSSQGFSIDPAAAKAVAAAMESMCSRLRQNREAIEDVRKGMLRLESRSFRKTAVFLRLMETAVTEEQQKLLKMSDVLSDSADLYKRTEKRITLFS